MNVKHLGNGIVLIEDLLNADELQSIDLNLIESQCTPQGYKKIDGKDYMEGGYHIPKEDLPTMPIRYMQDIITLPFYQTIDNAMYQGLIEYCKLFPVAAECITNSVKKHFIKYFPGNFMGVHSDLSLAYKENTVEPVNSTALGNTITVSIILNDDFEGGSILFNTWGIEIKPKSGSALFYPSNYIGAHQVNEITSGIRWAFLGFYSQGDEVVFSEPEKNNYLERYEWTTKFKNDLRKAFKKEDQINLNCLQKKVSKNRILN